MADFILESTPPPEDDSHIPTVWILFIDGLATLETGGADIILNRSNQHMYKQALRFEFKIYNNEVKYEALLSGF